MKAARPTITEPHPCSYLPPLEARTEYTYVRTLAPEEYEDLMNAGYRKFGSLLFRPVCEACRACRPIRVCVGRFAPNRSQSRAWRRNEDLRAVTSWKPTVDERRLELYHRYHAWRAGNRGWGADKIGANEYIFNFLHNPLAAVELTLWDGDELRGVALTEVTPNTVSAIYHYHDPGHERRSLGTAVILRIMELARKLGKPWVYLGFHVAGCASMDYKLSYRPCEILGVDGVWREPGGLPPQSQS